MRELAPVCFLLLNGGVDRVNVLKRLLTFMAVVLAMTYSPTRADLLDITTVGSQVHSTGDFGGDFFVSGTFIGAAGTGHIDPFVRIQQNGSEAGYDTDFTAKAVLQDQNGSWTHTLQLSDVPIINIGGVNYREFLLDANQTGNGNISLNQVIIFQSAADVGLFNSADYAPASATTDASISFAGATRVFQMSNITLGTLTSHEVVVNSGNGSGTLDMALYVRDDDFTGGPFVTLFSQFGAPPGTFAADDGFEEWKVRTLTPGAVPEPSTMAIAGLGAFGFLAYALRRRVKK
jgi:hypothetical protein